MAFSTDKARPITVVVNWNRDAAFEGSDELLDALEKGRRDVYREPDVNQPTPSAPKSQETIEGRLPFQTGAPKPSYADDPPKQAVYYEKYDVNTVEGRRKWQLHAISSMLKVYDMPTEAMEQPPRNLNDGTKKIVQNMRQCEKAALQLAVNSRNKEIQDVNEIQPEVNECYRIKRHYSKACSPNTPLQYALKMQRMMSLSQSPAILRYTQPVPGALRDDSEEGSGESDGEAPDLDETSEEQPLNSITLSSTDNNAQNDVLFEKRIQRQKWEKALNEYANANQPDDQTCHMLALLNMPPGKVWRLGSQRDNFDFLKSLERPRQVTGSNLT
ncbi:uncharacterized protein N7459_006702 [Penicillium hispanicum]|uniref:uncharacterized protein n=1 Tax=Penicillium hispanicum TaxID=1080232 RepID=UPI0025415F9A|nr:uncharacterized protein N7459_006702 [Penicillium hispanicum]KAJ5577738.1 hypothetical protein N7459_006702 [Penicillium hispanicum]